MRQDIRRTYLAQRAERMTPSVKIREIFGTRVNETLAAFLRYPLGHQWIFMA